MRSDLVPNSYCCIHYNTKGANKKRLQCPTSKLVPKIFIAPFLELWVEVWTVLITCFFQGFVKVNGVLMKNGKNKQFKDKQEAKPVKGM